MEITAPFKDPRKKLSDDQRMFVLRMYGEGHNPPDISREVKARFNVDIHRGSVEATCNATKNQPYVKHFRDSYLARVQEVPIANKRIRIDDYQKDMELLNKMIDKIKSIGMDKLTNKGREELSLLIHRKCVLKSEIREEMEKKPHLFQNFNLGIVGEMNDETLHARKQELIAKFRGTVDRGIARTESDTDGIGQESI